jgi:hypothetical protein
MAGGVVGVGEEQYGMTSNRIIYTYRIANHRFRSTNNQTNKRKCDTKLQQEILLISRTRIYNTYNQTNEKRTEHNPLAATDSEQQGPYIPFRPFAIVVSFCYIHDGHQR